MPIATICELQVFDAKGGASTYTFGALEGAYAWVATHAHEHGYCIEVREAHPCDPSDPKGQLWWGVIFQKLSRD